VFCAALTSLGTDGRDYRELAQDIKSVSGGLNVSPMLVPDANLPGGFSRNIAISSHCLDRNLDSMFALWQDVMASPRFDEQDHLRTIVGMMAADAANSIAGSGHSYAMMSAASTVSGLSAVSETYSGLSQVALLSDLAGNDDMDLIVAKIREVGQHVFGSPARMSMVCGHQAKDRAEAAMFAFADALPAAPQHAAGDASGAPHARPTPASTFHEMPVTINFAARAVPTVPYTHPDSPTLSVLASVLSSKFLHREIREKGGAYGGGAGHSDGLFKFYSYRDPNTKSTLDAFDASVEWATQGNIKDSDVDEAKLSIFQKIDAPVSPGARGTGLFLHGITNDMKQARRELLLDVTPADLVDVAGRYLGSSAADQTAGTAVLGTAQEADLFDNTEGWTVKRLN